jgi:hypothetical protein
MDARDMTVAIAFDKAENPARLINLRATITLPHGSCTGRNEVLRRVAEDCPVHETITTLQGLALEIVDEAALATPA